MHLLAREELFGQEGITSEIWLMARAEDHLSPQPKSLRSDGWVDSGSRQIFSGRPRPDTRRAF